MSMRQVRFMQGVVVLGGVLCLVLSFLALPACNTVEGVGEDVEGAGRSIDRAAEDVRD